MASSTAGAVVYFMLPLPEPISLPEGIPFPYEEVEDYGDFLNRVAREGAGENALDRGPLIRRSISIVWHQVEALPGDQLGIMTLMELAEKALPWAKSGRRPRLRSRLRRALQRFRLRQGQRQLQV